MRRWLVVGAVLAVLASAPAVALAVTSAGEATAPMSCQTTRWTRTAVSAGSSFAPIQSLRTETSAIFPVSVTVSGVVRGRPVAFKIVDHWVQTDTAQPGVVRVRPAGGRATPFSFTWVAPGSSAAVRGHRFDVEWRRLTDSGSSVLVKGDVALAYTTDVCS